MYNYVESIVSNLRESRLHESNKDNIYDFSIPWREKVIDDYDQVEYHKKLESMKAATEIMSNAKESFNDTDLAKYSRDDHRTSDCNITSMTMSFTGSGECVVTVTTPSILDEEQISNIIEYLEAQMSDGWGEGFEQKEVYTYSEEEDEWIDDEDEEDGGYYDVVDVEYSVYGQFYWTDSSYEIEMINSEISESTTLRNYRVDYVNSADKSQYTEVSAKDEKEAEQIAKKTLGREIYRVVQISEL